MITKRTKRILGIILSILFLFAGMYILSYISSFLILLGAIGITLAIVYIIYLILWLIL